MLEKWFTSPDAAREHALAEWKKWYRRTCFCADGAGLREEAGHVECSCGRRIALKEEGK